MSALLSLSKRCTVEWSMTHSTVRAREREARCGHRTPPRESLARKPIRGKRFTREFHGHRDFPASPPGLISIKVNFAEVPFINVFGAPWRRTRAVASLA